MPSIIDRLREKSESKRKIIALLISLFITFFIIAGWLYIKARPTLLKSEIVVDNSEKDGNSPIQYIKENFKSLFSGSENIIDDIKSLTDFGSSTSTTSTTTEYDFENKNKGDLILEENATTTEKISTSTDDDEKNEKKDDLLIPLDVSTSTSSN